MKVINVEYPTNPKQLYEGEFVKYSTQTSRYPQSLGGIWYFMDEVKKSCEKLGYPGIFLYNVEEMADVPINDRLEKSVYIRWDFIRTHNRRNG
ncbi:MAG: hypothetical protein ACK5OW_01555 [bacterium]|jgi:hypothetical protein